MYVQVAYTSFYYNPINTQVHFDVFNQTDILTASTFFDL